MNCKNCGENIVGNYCYNCGLKVIDRIDNNHIFTQFFDKIWNINNGFFGTLKTLIVNPKMVVSEYLRGNIIRYYSPFGGSISLTV